MASSTTLEDGQDPKVADVIQLFGKVELSGAEPSDLIDTKAALSSVLDSLEGLPTQPPSIYIDLEGERLSRQGTVSILQIYVLPTKSVYLIDIHTLRDEAFAACGSNGHTLKDLLESKDVPKVFFDVRNDSDALYSHFDIRLAGIQDLQLMEVATRTFPRRHVHGLAKCIERDGLLSADKMKDWKVCKEKGVQLFSSDRGGSYNVFNERPLSKEIVRYCIEDVHFMPRLWAIYNRKMTPEWRQRVDKDSAERVRLSQSASYVGHGQHKALAPQAWLYL